MPPGKSAIEFHALNLLHSVSSLPSMSSIPLDVHDVFRFSSDNKEFRPSQQFANDLNASASPFIIMLLGNYRTGKSTRANQILQHELNPDSPFQVFCGSEPVTMKFQYCGPFKFGQLSQIHDIPLQVDSDPDIFLIDCEGLHCSGNTPAVLKQATFALSQLASMTVLVMKDFVNHESIDNVRSFFVLSHAFSRHLPGFEIGRTIMMREIGIRYPRGKKLTLDEKDQLRQELDSKEREKILEVLNHMRCTFSERDLLVLAQPTFGDQELYWKSINDFLFFAAAIAGRRKPISGKCLLALFEATKPSIMAISDFSNPSIPFEQIKQTIANRCLKQAHDIALAGVETDIHTYIVQLNIGCLREGIDAYFVGDAVVRSIHVFEEKAEELFPGLLGYSPENTEEYRQSIKMSVESISNTLFVKQCISVLIPDLQTEIMRKIVDAIDAELKLIPIQDIGAFTFADLLFRHEESASGQFEAAVWNVHGGILTSPDFPNLVRDLRKQVSNHVKHIETNRKLEHAQYVAKEIAREKKRRESQYEEEEQRYRLQMEQNRALMEQNRALMEQNSSLVKQLLAQQQENAKVMLAMNKRFN
jgi:hypothetical protein